MSITLYPDPIINAGPDVDIPLGGYTVLNASGATTYLWNEDPNLSAYDIANPTSSPQDTTTYIVMEQMRMDVSDLIRWQLW